MCRYCSLIPGFGVKLSAIILAGPTVLSAVGACPPHDGVRRRWWINVASAVSLIESSQKIGRSHHRHRPGRDIFSRRTAGTLWSRYCSLRRKLLRPVELGSVHPHAGRIVDRGLEAERGDRADTSSFQSPRAMRDNSSVNRSCRAIAASIMPSVIANSSTPTDCSNLRPTSSIDWQLSKPSGSGSDAAISLAPSSAYFSGLFSRNFSMTDAVGLKVGLKCRQEIRGPSLAQAGR